MPTRPTISFTVRLHGVEPAHAIATATHQLQVMAPPFPDQAGQWAIDSVALETDTWSMEGDGTMRWLSVEGTAKVSWQVSDLGGPPAA